MVGPGAELVGVVGWVAPCVVAVGRAGPSLAVPVCGNVNKVAGRAVPWLDCVCVPVVWPGVKGLETGVWADGVVVGGLAPRDVAGPSVAAVMGAAACVVLAVGSVSGPEVEAGPWMSVLGGGVRGVVAGSVASAAAGACPTGFPEGELAAAA